MPWKIDYAEHEPDGSVNVCRLAFHDKDAKGKDRKRVHQLQTAIRIPPPGPGHGQAIAALKKLAKELGKPADPPDVSAIEDKLNAEDE